MKKNFYQTQYKDCLHPSPAPKHLSEDSLILQEALSLLIILSELSLNSEPPWHHVVKTPQVGIVNSCLLSSLQFQMRSRIIKLSQYVKC